MPGKAKITTQDIDGKIWEKEGDFVFGGIGNRGADGGISNTEVDMSGCTKSELIALLGNILITAGDINPLFPLAAIQLFEQYRRSKVMENLYCTITGGRIKTMRLKLFLRLLNLIILLVIHQMFGMDIVIIVGLVIVVADLDEIAESIQKKIKEKC